mmetsp:Transcript_9687/g.16806  ORF Transcript_9687/g.16806 Transcript_9687/m.16806 type:complete len:277 (-) Transcript_9687:710-1540(-)
MEETAASCLNNGHMMSNCVLKCCISYLIVGGAIVKELSSGVDKSILVDRRTLRHVGNVRFRELHSSDERLLLLELVAVRDEGVHGNVRLGKLWELLLGVHNTFPNVFHTNSRDERADLIIINSRPNGSEEINRLRRERVDEQSDVFLRYLVIFEDAMADADLVIAGRSPEKLLHAPVSNQGRVQGREIITCNNNRDARNLFLIVHARKLHIRRIVCDVHQGCVDHLIVHGVLGGRTHAASTSVEIVDHQNRHLSLTPDDIGSLTVTSTDQLGRLTG